MRQNGRKLPLVMTNLSIFEWDRYVKSFRKWRADGFNISSEEERQIFYLMCDIESGLS